MEENIMLSNQVLQRTISEIENIAGGSCSVWAMDGHRIVQAGTESMNAGERIQAFLEEIKKEEIFQGLEEIRTGYALFLVCDEEKPAYILNIENMSGEKAEIVGRLGVKQMEGLIRAYKEKIDKNRFLQNLLLDNMLLVDVYNQAKKLHIENDQKRVVYLVEARAKDNQMLLETMKGMYASGMKDFVTAVDEGSVILVKALEETDGYREVFESAKSIADTVSAEAMVNIRVSYGTMIHELKDVSKSYKEAGMALDVGRIFYPDRNILAYNELGIGRLIHQLPLSLCEMFLKEVFGDRDVSEFEEETLSTVYKFFENNLNISETARQLYIHRNTLVYRLDKLQKSTGLDLRVFEDAITFKIALMVVKYMKYMENMDY